MYFWNKKNNQDVLTSFLFTSPEGELIFPQTQSISEQSKLLMSITSYRVMWERLVLCTLWKGWYWTFASSLFPKTRFHHSVLRKTIPFHVAAKKAT